MAKDPAFLFYSQDFFTGVATLTFEERGQFITLLCLMHQKGRMDEKTIRFLVGNVSDNLKSKFKIDGDGLWYNERLETEAKKRSKFTESRRANGSKGGRPKKNAKPKAKPIKNHMVIHMEDENENENIIEDVEVAEFFDFDTWWDMYDHKQDRAKCEGMWRKISDADKEQIFKHTPGYILSTPDKKFRRHPKTYLGNRSWENEILKTEDKNGKTSKGWAAPTLDDLVKYQRAKHGMDI